MGYLRYLYKLDVDPTDSVSPYSAYEFKPVEMSMNRDFARRESVMVVPSMDSVLDGFGRIGGPMDRRDQSFTFRKFSSNGDLDADYDRLAAWLAPGTPIRLVYQTDSGALWYTTASNPKLSDPITSANNWGSGGYQDFSIVWRIRPDWRPRFSETANVFHSGALFHTGAHFGSAGVTIIAANPQPFTIDATGTAGVNLPTIPETAMTVILTGPCGGDSGIRVLNFSSFAYDTNGVKQPMYFDVPYKLPTSSDSAVLRMGAQAFGATIGGVGRSFRPVKPVDSNGMRYQREWWRIEAGVNNGCNVAALGANAVTGGTIKVDWWRRRA